MTEPFSLLRQAWIPVSLRSGRRTFIRPCDISEPVDGDDIVRIATGRPDCDIALTEFLIGLLAITMDGTDRRGWARHYQNPPSRTELEAAFAPLERAMILDGDGPRFFQDFERLSADTWPVDDLFVDAAADYFTKPGAYKSLSRSGAAIALLTIQTVSPEGGRGHVVSLRGGGPLTTLVEPTLLGGKSLNLWQLIWINTPDGFSIEKLGLESVFPWLAPTRRNDENVKTTPEDVHISQVFFGLPRRIRLTFSANTEHRQCDLTGIQDDTACTMLMKRPGGTKYEAWGSLHPLSPCYRSNAKEEFLTLHANSSRVGYRDWIGLVVSDKADNTANALPARIVAEYQRRVGELRSSVRLLHRLRASGYVLKKNKPLDFAEALMPLVITGEPRCDELVTETARRLIGSAEQAAGLTVAAVTRGLYGEGNKPAWDASPIVATRDRVWADTEAGFYRLLEGAAADFVKAGAELQDQEATLLAKTMEAWRQSFRAASLTIFDDIVPIEDADSDRIGDVIAGRRMLVQAFAGLGTAGRKLYGALGLTTPDAKAKAEGKSRPKPKDATIDEGSAG